MNIYYRKKIFLPAYLCYRCFLYRTSFIRLSPRIKICPIFNERYQRRGSLINTGYRYVIREPAEDPPICSRLLSNYYGKLTATRHGARLYAFWRRSTRWKLRTEKRMWARLFRSNQWPRIFALCAKEILLRDTKLINEIMYSRTRVKIHAKMAIIPCYSNNDHHILFTFALYRSLSDI